MGAGRSSIVAAVALACVASVTAADASGRPERRWHVSFAWGGVDPTDVVRSDSGNVLTLVEPDGRIADRFLDLRDDAAITGTLEIQSSMIATVAVQLDLTRRIAVEGSIAWHEATVGDIELSRYNPSTRVAPREAVEVGELRTVPIELTAIWDFRPGKVLAPYAGFGIGYAFVGLDVSDALDRLSTNLDRSSGYQIYMLSENNGLAVSTINTVGGLRQFDGATVDARDSFEWHALAGTEYGLTERWTVFGELRYTRSSREITVRFNGEENLGIPVPEATVPVDSAEATAFYGPVFLSQGGLMDYLGDAEPDPGYYWIRGGTVDHDAFSARVGVRYSF